MYGGKLTGYCTAYSYYSCLAKVSTACPSGKAAQNRVTFSAPTGSLAMSILREVVASIEDSSWAAATFREYQASGIVPHSHRPNLHPCAPPTR